MFFKMWPFELDLLRNCKPGANRMTKMNII